METNPVPVTTGEKPRKRVSNPTMWKKNKEKTVRYKAKSLPIRPQCSHKNGPFLCTTLTMKDTLNFHAKFYLKAEKMYQDNFILKFTEIRNVKRRRPKNKKYTHKNRQTKYFVLNEQKQIIPVCLNAFIGILGVSRFRINRITRQFYENSVLRENRGGFRKRNEFQEKKNSVMGFINRLHCLESHYCRGKRVRKYLSSELNIKKLWRMYTSETDTIPVKESYFRMIFNTKYNLGFGSPRVDVCSMCLQLDEKLKSAQTEAEKNQLRTEKRVHRLRAKAFFDLLKTNDSRTLILSYDCQKNLPLPKLPDQQTYYSRQIYLYNFTVVKGHSKSKLTRDNVTAYCWTENKFNKDSNAIASCVFDSLNSSDFSDIDIVRLISDGCAGQNKNSTIIAMCCYWLVNKAPMNIKEVEINFPVTGHSFIPPDRVFGVIEKDLKKKEIICNPQELLDIISTHATIKNVGADCVVYDFKQALAGSMKKPTNFHFQLSKIKRIFIKRTSSNNAIVRGEYHYKHSLGVYRSLFLNKKVASDLHPLMIQEKNQVSAEKKTDVEKLLIKHYGVSWQVIDQLSFFINVLGKTPQNVDPEEQEPDNLCEEREEVSDLFV